MTWYITQISINIVRILNLCEHFEHAALGATDYLVSNHLDAQMKEDLLVVFQVECSNLVHSLAC